MKQELSTVDQQILKVFSAPTKENMMEIDKMLVETEGHFDQPTEHYFAKGAYLRTITLYAGTVTSSKIHKTQHFSLILEGAVTVAREDGSVEYIEAPHIMVTEPNTKRLIIAHEDTQWITFHVTDHDNVEDIERDIISKEFIEEEVE